MVQRTRHLLLAALATAVLGGCGDGPSAPDYTGTRSFTDLPVNADMELQVAGDEVLAEVIVEDMVLSMALSADGAGTMFAGARACFLAARELLRAGDEEGARAKAVECRRTVVEALVGEQGEEAVDELFGRVERLLERLDSADDEFERAQDLEERVETLLKEANELRARGETIQAGERLLLALQLADRMRHRHREFVRDPEGFARLSLARGAEAIRLARDLIEEPTPLQERAVFHAEELLRRAGFALAQGHQRRAVVLARRSEGRALFAVLDGEPPTVEDALGLLAVADRMVAAAEEAIGADPTPLQQLLLQRSFRLRNAGAEAVNAWKWRGVALLWHAAVTAGILVEQEP